jgi:hypothetical protein
VRTFIINERVKGWVNFIRRINEINESEDKGKLRKIKKDKPKTKQNI